MLPNFHVFGDRAIQQIFNSQKIIVKGGVSAISIEKRNFDPRKSNIDQNMKIRLRKNIPLYGSAPTCGNMFYIY